MLNKITLLMSFSLAFCCCGWTGRIRGERPNMAALAEQQVTQHEARSLSAIHRHTAQPDRP